MKASFVVVGVACLLLQQPVFAGAGSSLVKGAVRKFAGEAVEAGVKKSAKLAAERATAKAVKEAAEATARRTASTVARRFGHVAASAPGFADDFAAAAARMTARSERRLMMMAPALAESGQAGAVVARLSAGNADELIETLWKHKEKLARAAVVTGLLVHGDDFVESASEHIVEPIIVGATDHVVAPASRLVVSAAVLAMLIGVAAMLSYVFGYEARQRVIDVVQTIRALLGRQP